jgi:glycosyltransferase involved in cell wall biosynthesis
LNLLYTLTSYPPAIGGAQYLQHQTATKLSSKHEIQVLTFWNRNRSDWLLGTTLNAGDHPDDYLQDGIPVHLLGFDWKTKAKLGLMLPFYYPFMKSVVPRMASVIEEQIDPFVARADLVHNVRIGREPLTYASQMLAKKRHIPFVLSPVHHPRWEGWRYKLYNQLYRDSDAVIAITYAEKDILKNLGVPGKKIFVTGMGPVISPESNAERFRKDRRIDGPIVLFIGQQYLHKGFVELLHATKAVWESFPDVNFVFIGPPVSNSSAIFLRYSDPRIRYLGKVDIQEKTDALGACTLLCVPSTQESFGGIYTEAWSLGKPVIGCRIPAVSEVIDDGINGFLVNQNPDDIAKAIITLLQDEGLRDSMGEAGRMKVQERYSWKHLAALTEQVYFKVSGMTSAPALDASHV